MKQSKQLIESNIIEARKKIVYNTRDLPLETYLSQAKENKIKITQFWVRSHRTQFIESLLLGLPVFKIVLIGENADITSAEQIEQQFITGKGKLLSAIDFFNNNFELTKEHVKLPILGGIKFEDLSLKLQGQYMRTTVRAIVIDPKSDLTLWNSN